MAFVNTCNPMTFQYNVGIGTDTNLVQTLTVCGTNTRVESRAGGNTNAGAYYTVYNGASLVGQSSQFVDNAGNWILYTGTTSEAERLRVTAAGNLGIGTTSPQSALHVTNTVAVSPSAPGFHAGIDSNGYASIQLTGCASLGSYIDFSCASTDFLGRILYDTTNNYMSFGVCQAERMRITNSGNVGIGTTSPTYNLVVGNDLGNLSTLSTTSVVGNTSANSFFVIGQSATRNLQFNWQYNATAGSACGQIVTYGYSNPISIDGSRLVLQSLSGGKVGIGTATGNGQLTVAVDQSVNNQHINIVGTQTSYSQEYSLGIPTSTKDFRIYDGTAGATRFTLTSTGNVGIGTTSPGAIFHVSGSGDVLMRAQSSGASSTAASYYLTAVGGVAKRYYAGINVSSANGAFEVYDDTCASSRLLVSSVGNVGIGTTTPQSSLHVAGTLAQNPTGTGVHIGIDAGGYAGIQLTGGTTQGAYIDFSCTGTDAPGRIIYYITSNSMDFTVCGGSRMTIVCNGNIGIATATPSYKLHVNGTFYAAGSSIKYKEGICNYDTDSCLFMCLKPVAYQYKDEWQHLGRELKSQSQIGLIAEDVAEVMPELAILVNEDDEKVVRNVDYEKLSVVLLKEVQKLRQEVDELKNNK